MANNSAKIAKMARNLAIVHIIVGFLLLGYGIADRVLEYSWTGYGCYGIWTGIWMIVAGGLGIPGTRKKRSRSRNAFGGVFMGFSITSAVFGGAIIIIYSIGLATYGDWLRKEGYLNTDGYYSPTESYRFGRRRYHYPTERSKNKSIYHLSGKTDDGRYDPGMALMSLLLIFGVAEFVTGIWVAVCLCLMKPCTCCYSNPSTPQRQMTNESDTAGCSMYYPVGCTMGCPMHGGGGMVAMQTMTPGSWNGMVLVPVPVSGALNYPPQMAQVSTPGAMATVYRPRQDDTPQSSSHGGYIRLTNEQDFVNT